ncbi:fungal-specific transcription factor domain-containing protein [Bisporella sp. PMI_857]|nr:fungal-specific transcription factor domain-containing protein [Bisporella sp. PMI_857]
MLSESISKKRRVSHACKICGSRKVKCDGAVPSCGRCISDNAQCFYEVSKRNTRLPPPSSLVPLQERSLQSPSLSSHASKTREPCGHIPADLSHDSNRLFQAYFRCIHPIWPLLYKPLYNSLDHQQLLEVIPRPLVYAILSLAVLIQHVDFETDHLLKHDQAQQYFDEALSALKDTEASHKSKSLVEVKSSILHCQVYTILALQQHSIGAFSQAGILCAVAVSMAIDQSLHRISDVDNHAEAQVKSRLWWTIYVLEKMLSCEMSRPTLLRAEEAETPFPSVEESDEYELYSESAHAETIVNQRRTHLRRSRTISAFHTSIGMAKIMESVSREIYSNAARQRIRQDREAGEETRLRLWAELQDYETALENSPLKLDTSGNSESIPVIVTNYVYMWLTTILLHRPFIESWQSGNNSATASGPKTHPSDICFFAANQICSTIKMYTRYMCGLPCDMIFPIFVAANILLHRLRQVGGKDALIRPRLELCVKWLNGLGKSWKSAEARQQMLSESINSTYQDTQVQVVEGNIEAGNPLEDYSNFTMLSTDNSFDLEYLQWVNSFDPQPFVNQ